MTIEREENGIVHAVCDGCGDRRLLDDEPFGPDDRAVAVQLADLGWEQREPAKVRFTSALDRGHVASYPQDLCGDCQTDEPAPAPLMGARRMRQARIEGDDPCDEWPRPLIWQALGLQAACGHPIGNKLRPCSWCEAGYPIGRIDRRWRR